MLQLYVFVVNSHCCGQSLDFHIVILVTHYNPSGSLYFVQI